MTLFQIMVDDEQAKTFLEMHKQKLAEDGGLDKQEVEELKITDALNYALYSWGEYIDAPFDPYPNFHQLTTKED